jgi:acyl-[acyl-carrier-protein]-phospholipid O-acyltransferase/long-chain-fatty-acid--[acyl-carrier-protein] ligase
MIEKPTDGQYSTSPAGSGSYRALLTLPSYRALLAAQFSGALNDNLYRMVASLFAVSLATGGDGSGYVALAGALFVLPYLTLSGWAGHLADTVGKRPILIAAKIAELLVMILAMAAFFFRSIEFVLVVLFLMATQSTFFSPARYGILPNIVAKRDLSRANGLGEMSVYWAILIGSGLGGALSEFWQDKLYLAALPMIAISALGLFACVRVSPTAPLSRFERSDVRSTVSPSIRPNGSALIAGLRMLRVEPALGLGVLGVSLIWGLGAMMQFDILLFGKSVLGLGETAIGLLQATLGLGIGAGCLLAGWLSGDQVRLGLSQIGIAGVAVAVLALGIVPPNVIAAYVLVTAVGLAGGLFVVPMISLLHHHSLEESRGRLFATNNVLNMLGVLLGIGAVYGLHDIVGVNPTGVFVVIGAIALTITIATLPKRCVIPFGDRGTAPQEQKKALRMGCES